MFVNLSDEDTGQITITENAELRTGPNAAYPVIYKIEKGESFKKIDRKGKWIEVQNHAGTEKGWVAGWHTNLNIPADQSLSSNPLKEKQLYLTLVTVEVTRVPQVVRHLKVSKKLHA